MSARTRKTQFAEQHIEKALVDSPFYVTEYIRAKKRELLSPNTLSGYLHDFKRFFDWLRMESLTDAKCNKDIPYSVLENLKKKDIEYFFEMLINESIEKSEDVFQKRSAASTNRTIQSLKSLFNYLTVESEKDEDGECYFYRNVMAKIKPLKKTESASRRARRINSNTLDGKELIELIEFMKNNYEKSLTPNQLVRFERDKLRDVAIVSLFSGSGIRVNELAGLLITEVDFQQGYINIVRKGGGLDSAQVTPSAMNDLKAYIERARQQVYKPDNKNLYVFLTRYRGKANPIAVETIQKVVNKYTRAFLSNTGKKLSPHQLRHSFSKHWIDKGGSLILLKSQLGHESVETTILYTNFSQEEHRDILLRMDGNDDDAKNES